MSRPSWSPRQQSRFARQGAALRAGVSGQRCFLAGVEICAALSPIRRARAPVAGGFEAEFDFIARISRPAHPRLTPEVGAEFTIVGENPARTYRVTAVADFPASAEWRLELAQVG
jgi:hypothetical protein